MKKSLSSQSSTVDDDLGLPYHHGLPGRRHGCWGPTNGFPRWRPSGDDARIKALRITKQSSLKLPRKYLVTLCHVHSLKLSKSPKCSDSWIETYRNSGPEMFDRTFKINLECFKQINHIPMRGGGIGLVPSRELTYPLPRPFWRWFSFSPGGIC